MLQQSTSLATVLSVLNTTRSTDIAKVVQALDPTAQDTLMKYLYKGMQSVEEGGNCSVLLNWHEKVELALHHIGSGLQADMLLFLR